MNQAQLFYDLNARLRSDTGAGGLFPTGGTPLVTGIFNNFAAETQDMPYIVYTLISGPQDDCFDVDMTDVEFQLSVFCSKRPADLLKSTRILNRIYGNGIKQSNRLPTYGLHRHTLVSAWPDSVDTTDKWLYTACTARRPYEEHGEDYYHFGRAWGLRMYKTFASTQ